MSPTTSTEVADRGLQQERTLLAWDRTGVSMTITGAILVRTESVLFPAVFATIGTAAIVAGTWLVVLGNVRYRDPVLRTTPRPVRPALIRVVGLSTVALALATVARLLVG